MNVYEYVAESNPRLTEQLMNSFNYDVIDTPDMGLSQLVDTVGERALNKVMELHPDKEIILELFSKSNDTKDGICNCDGCKIRNRNNNDDYMNYLNATGSGAVKPASTVAPNDTSTNTHLLANQTNVILVVSALFIATALILKK